MSEENYMTFEEFLKTQRQQPEDDKPVEEILSDVRDTLNTFKGRWVA